jgi:hypothetical protein
VTTEPTDKWRVETNDRYAKIVSSVTSLATGALVLPALFLREFLGVPKETALLPFINWWAYVAWSCFGLSIILGLGYSWLSVKWVKLAWGIPIKHLPEARLNFWLDFLFVSMALCFLAGMLFLVVFFNTSHVANGSQTAVVGPC